MRKITAFALAPLLAFAISSVTLDPAGAGTFSKPSIPSSSTFSRPPTSSFGFSKPVVRDTAPPAPSYATPPKAVVTPTPVVSPATSYTKPVIAAPPTPVASPATSYTKPVIAATPAPVASPANSFGYSKPTAAPTPVASSTPQTYKPTTVYNPSTALGASSSKVMSGDALKKYQAERLAAKTPPQPVDIGSVRRDPGFASAASRYGSVDSYMTARGNSMVIYRNAHPDVYVYTRNIYPNYGAYDSSFLVGMMLGYVGSEAANAQWMYAHQYDPWYAQWHADMMRQAQDNADLHAKLLAQDAELARLKASGAQPTSQALPAGVDPSLAIAPEAMIANASSVADDARFTQEQPESHTMRNTVLILLVLLVGGVGYLYVAGRRS